MGVEREQAEIWGLSERAGIITSGVDNFSKHYVFLLPFFKLHAELKIIIMQSPRWKSKYAHRKDRPEKASSIC